MVAQSAVQLPSTAPKLGDVFDGKYRVDGVLGIGGMGYVIAATHLHLRERVAIKILLPELASDATTVERFLREGRAAVKIRSPHVARVRDVGELPDRTPYLVLEYLEGSDLGALLDVEQRLPFQVAVDYVLAACEAIAEAHAMNTVHRDLKPANLFLAQMPDGSSCIKVLDFGISKMSSTDHGSMAMTSTLAVMGSPAYMSPEQLKSSRAVDARADIWSIGVILYELISGHLPFDAPTVAEITVQILSEEPTWLALATPGVTVPDELAGVVAVCLQKKLDARFVNLADFADAVAPFGSGRARESSARIAQTLALPLVRARRMVAPPTIGGAIGFAATVHAAAAAGAAPPPPSLVGGTTGGRLRKSRAVALAIVASLVAAMAITAVLLAVRYRRAHAAPDLALTTTSDTASAPSAPPAAAPAPVPDRSAGAEIAPPATSASAVPTPTIARAPTGRPAPARSTAPIAARAPASAPASSTPPVRPPLTPSGIATTSKD